MKKIKLILLMMLVVSSVMADVFTEDVETKYSLSVSPQYVITGGMRFDFDVKVAEKAWFTIAPILYYTDDSYMYAPESTSYTGVGGFLNYRYFPTGKGMYAGAGLNYRYLDVTYSDYEEDAGETAKFNTYGFDINFGYQFRLVEQLFMDLYLGWGFRYTQQNTVEDDAYWSEAFLGLGYSGFLPVAGLRLGFEF